VLDVARQAGMRIVGPNSFGVQNSGVNLNASIASGAPLAVDGRPGISLVTQSGAYGMAAHTLGRDEAIRFAKVYAAGNKADIADHELLDYLADDPETGVICLLLESISNPRLFFEHAGRAVVRKPVFATVTGRSAPGRRAAQSHTAALGRDEVLLDAMLRQAGVVRTSTGLAMLDAARVVVDQPIPAGPRVGIITNSGGTGVELVDLLIDRSLVVPVLGDELQATLRELLPPYASTGNPVDMTPVWPRFPELYPTLIDALARSGEVDIVVPILLQRAASEAVAIAVRAAVQRLRDDGVDVPVYVCWVASRAAQPAADLLQTAGVPCLPWPERTAQAVSLAVQSGLASGPAHVGSTTEVTGPQHVRLGSARLEMPRTVLQQRDFLARAGIRIAGTESCGSAAEAVAAADRFGYPVVLKVEHPALTHKSDVGGVRTSLLDQAAVRRSADELFALISGARVLVQQQHHGLELVVGGLKDDDLGPVVMVGLGGVLVELVADTGFAVAPIDMRQALRLWRSLQHASLLNGFRGTAAVDIDALAALAVTVGDLMVANPALRGLDLNPVLATADGYVVVDWRMDGDFSALG
jgi:acetate---CoA ligase (ADP-forming)